MASQAAIKKQFNFGKKVKSCSTCRYCIEDPSNAEHMICKKIGIVLENVVIGTGDELATNVCDAWEKLRRNTWTKKT